MVVPGIAARACRGLLLAWVGLRVSIVGVLLVI